MGLPWIPPEIREDAGEFEAAAAGRIPRLVELSDIKADLHMHSDWSDGKASIRAMAEAARARGYTHIALTDHSAFLGVTNGLDGARLRQQAAEVQALNAEYAAAASSAALKLILQAMVAWRCRTMCWPSWISSSRRRT